MSRIRAEQIQDLTLRDQNISETANIDQSKIEDWQSDALGWLSQGIVKAVPHTFFTDDDEQDFEDFWDGSQAGQLYFDVDNDELYIGTATDPFYNLVAGHGTEGQPAGWDSQIVVQMGSEATDYNGDTAATHIGTNDLTSGYDWGTEPQEFGIDVNGAGEVTVILDTETTDLASTVTEVNDALSAAGVTEAEAFADSDMYVGIKTVNKGSSQAFTLFNRTENALANLGMSTGTYTGTDGPNLGTTFDLGVDVATDGTNTQIYLNGALMENATAGDYQVVDPQTIQFNYDIYGEDKVTAIVYNDASFTNYATKAYVDNLFYGESGHTHDGVDSVKLNFNEAMEISTDIDGSGVNGVLINHHLVPTVDTRNLGSSANPWGNIYANEGHFAASSIYIDNATLRFNTEDGTLEFSEDAGSSYKKFAPSKTPDAPTAIESDTGQPITLTSDSGIEIIGDILPDTASSRNIGSSDLPFSEIHTDEMFVSSSSLYVNGKKVLHDVSDTMTFSTDPNQAIMIQTQDDSGSRGNANITFTSANEYSVDSIGDMTFTIGNTLTDKDIAFVNNSSNGSITFNGGKLVTYDNIEPGSNGDLHIGAEGKAFNDIFVNTVLFRPLAEGTDYAKIDSEVVDTTTLVKHQIGANASDSIVFQGNDGTSISDLMIISGDGKVTISGDLIVNGTTTTVNSETTQISDSSFVIKTADPAVDGDASYEVQRENGNSKLFWNDTSHLWEVVEGANAEYTREISNPKRIDGVDFHQDDTNPSGSTRLNMDGYFYATRVYNAVYNDLAEFMLKAEDAEAGDVVVMTENGLVPSKKRLDGAVVGVYSDSYGYALGAEDQENKIPVAISGRVWVKIAEPCKIGDLLVSGKKGRASVRRSGDNVLGKVLGKVLKNKDNYDEERIEMLVMNS